MTAVAISSEHERGQVREFGGGWRAVCGCGWEGPPRPHPLDAGSDLTGHAVDPAGVTPLEGGRDG